MCSKCMDNLNICLWCVFKSWNAAPVLNVFHWKDQGQIKSDAVKVLLFSVILDITFHVPSLPSSLPIDFDKSFISHSFLSNLNSAFLVLQIYILSGSRHNLCPGKVKKLLSNSPWQCGICVEQVTSSSPSKKWTVGISPKYEYNRIFSTSDLTTSKSLFLIQMTRVIYLLYSILH